MRTMRLLARRAARAAAALLVLGGAVCAATPAWAQDEDPETIAARKVEEAQRILEEMAVAAPERVYALGSKLREVAGDEDPVLRVVAEGLQSEKPSVVLSCAAIVVPDYGDTAPLLKLVRAGGAHAPWAADILGRLGERGDIDALRAILADESVPGAARRAAASGILQRHNSDGPAVAYLTEAVTAGPEPVTRAAALALADAGHVGAVKRVLASIATEPTVEGATARAYLRLDPLHRAVAKERADTGMVIDEVIKKVQEYYAHETAPDGKTAIDLTYLRDAAARGIIAHLDQFSQFMTLEDYRKNEERMRGAYGGIGAYVQVRPYRGDTGPEPRDVLTISAPIYRQWDGRLAPAYKAGLRSGDQVVRCQVPEQNEPVDLIGKSLQDCVGLLKGPPDTEVKVWVRRRSSAELREVTLRRATIEIDTAPGEMMPGGIGYCRILRFDNKTGSKDLANRLRVLRDAGAKGLILDLRGNPGGSLVEVVKCADWFLEPGKLVTTLKGRHQNWKNETYSAEGARAWTHPVVVLTDEDSASGAELLSGALRDHRVATIIGRISPDKPTGATFGKGCGQTFIPLRNSVEQVDGQPSITRLVRLTVFKYYLPKGDSVHKIGLIPDIAIQLPEYPEWQAEAADALHRVEAIATYVDGLVAHARTDPELKQRLFQAAAFDGFDAASYPGFDEWAAKLTTKLDAEALRRLVRIELRVQLADERAHEWLFDYQEDLHLQRGVRELLRKMQVDPKTVPQYRHFAERKFTELHPRQGETKPTRR